MENSVQLMHSKLCRLRATQMKHVKTVALNPQLTGEEEEAEVRNLYVCGHVVCN